MVNDESNLDNEVTLLFNTAKERIRMVEKDSLRLKKQIIIELAKSLDGKIPTDTICIEIKNQLRGNNISERHIEECLDEKYKQAHRVKNAQKRNNSESQSESRFSEQEDNLAELSRLNQEDKLKEKALSQDIIIKGSNDQMLSQVDKNNKTNETSSPIIVDRKKVASNEEDSLSELSPTESNEPFQFISNKCPECKIKNKKIIKMEEQILALEAAIKESSPFTQTNMLKPTEIKDCVTENTSSDINFDSLIECKDLEECLPPPILRDDDTKIKIHGKFDMQNKRVHSLVFEKL